MKMYHRVAFGLVLMTLLMLLPQAEAWARVAEQSCFKETGFCIDGRIQQYWEQNGGLPVFGFPITQQRTETVEGKSYQVQWFERNRFELHPENKAPYDVLLGRLGDDRLRQQGRDWSSFPKVTSAGSDCLFIQETGHSICGAFLKYFLGHGLEFDGNPGSKSLAESIALFGLPLSEPQEETYPNGKFVSQWFERARFEAHPENQPPYDVLLGLLGNEINPPRPAPAPSPTPTPAPAVGYNGNWAGQGSGGAKTINFNVEDNAIASIEMELDFDFGSCNIEGKPSVTYFQGRPPITDKKFRVTFDSGRLTVEGTFTSTTAATGTYSYSIDVPGCRGSALGRWDATKK